MKRISEITLLIGISFLGFWGLSGCSTFGASGDSLNGPSRGNADADGASELGMRRPASAAVDDDPGFYSSRALSAGERDRMETRLELRQLENQLASQQDLQQYSRVKPYLNSDLSRIQFLRQGSFEAKERWLQSQGIYLTDLPTSSLVKAGEALNVGMTRPQVRDLLGEPDGIDVAGNPRYGNERWHYAASEASANGFHNQNYFIYFEAGHVAGWQTIR